MATSFKPISPKPMTPKQGQLVFITIMVVVMSCVMSFSMYLVNKPHEVPFSLVVWLKNWGIAFPIAWTTAYFTAPVARGVVARLSGPPSRS